MASSSNGDNQTPPVPSQLSPNLPGTTTHITGHNSLGQAQVHSSRPANWKPYDGGTMAFNQIFTNQFPADLSSEKKDSDIAYHDSLVSSGNLGLVSGNGVVCRMVDFGPGYECMMHRTSSLDFGVVIEGEVEMRLDDGSVTIMRRGDVAVQRGTMHSWRNVTEGEKKWARMMFVLQDVRQPMVINGMRLGEDLGRGTEGLVGSGNDV